MNIIRMAREAIRRIVAAPSSAEAEAEAFRKGFETGWAERLKQEQNNAAIAAHRLHTDKDLHVAVRKHLDWFERFICDRDELDSSTPRKVAQAAQEAAEDLRAALGVQS